MNISDAVEYIHSFINYEKTLSWEYPEAIKLERMRLLAKEFGNPQNAYENIIIAGSKGKGSTAAILASILRMDNYKVGLYTSPHLVDLRERIRVNGLLISEPRVVEYAETLKRILNDASWRKDPPTFFEVLTVMAFWHFREMKVHVAVLEVGLGGLYDSTNIAQAKAVGITPISLEHTEKLGKTIAKIAVQKCGVIKGREVVVSAPQVPEAEAVIQKACTDNEAKLLKVGKDIKIFERTFTENDQRFDVKAPFGNYFDLKLHLLGRHQLENAAVAIGLAKALEEKTRMKISEEAIERGVIDAAWPGRLEKMSDHPIIVFDGAHNPDSMEKTLTALKRHFHFNRIIAVIGVSGDKDAEGILEPLAEASEIIIATQSTNVRAMPVNLLAETARQFKETTLTEADPHKALEEAKRLSKPEDLILVTGSLFLLGDLKVEYA